MNKTASTNFYATRQSNGVLGEMEDPRITMQKQRNMMSEIMSKDNHDPRAVNQKMATVFYKNADPTPKQLASLRAFRKSIRQEQTQAFNTINMMQPKERAIDVNKLRINPVSALSTIQVDQS